MQKIKYFILFTAVLAMSSCNPEKENPIIASIGFENCEPGDFIEIIEAGIRINGEKDNVRIYPKK